MNFVLNAAQMLTLSLLSDDPKPPRAYYAPHANRQHPARRPLLAAWWLVPALLAALVALGMGALVADAIANAAHDAARFGEWRG